ncbi:MAG: hypothetical protein WCT50_04125 [Patescibacteria group bacterium]|jgi:hypothetical protein
MSRIYVYGNYEGKAFVLREPDGRLYQQIEPETKLTIAGINYFVKRAFVNRQSMVGLMSLDDETFNLSIAQLKKRTRGRRALLLRPGKGLWALNFGSAKRGVWHLMSNNTNPILTALWSHELTSQLLQVVDEINLNIPDGGNLCKHSKAGSRCFNYFTDGNIGELRKAVFGKHSRDGFCPIKEAYVQVTDGSYCVQSIRVKENNGKIYPRIVFVQITDQANKDEVAEIINNIMK